MRLCAGQRRTRRANADMLDRVGTARLRSCVRGWTSQRAFAHPTGLATTNDYTLIVSDWPALALASICAWCWIIRSRKLCMAVSAAPAGVVMLTCEPSA